jgi:hypothetical protein
MMFDNRYLSAEKLVAYLDELSTPFNKTEIGRSVQNRPINALQLGAGPIRVLMWSQMHGNEATTTRALIDLFDYLQHKGAFLLDALTLYIIPQLNPDGATAYTRHNANGIDLNRDALILSQPESQLFRRIFEAFNPQWCFNLHDQRSIYAAGPNGNPATLSFLAPSADEGRTLTPARKLAMEVIGSIFGALKDDLPQGIARYDDAFNLNCVGDYCTAQSVPTLLFEAGHYPEDYGRETTRKFVFSALCAALHAIAKPETRPSYETYLKIPENQTEFVDVLIESVDLNIDGIWYYNQQLAIQYEEKLAEGHIQFLPSLHAFGTNLSARGHLNFKFLKPESCFLSEKEDVKNENHRNLQILLQKLNK